MNPSHESSSHRRPLFSAWRLQIALGVTLFALGTQAYATDFYVDSQAAGGGNGSLGSPWNSIAQVNAHGNFAAGDNIWFKRGSVFSDDTLTIRGSGSSDTQRITYGAYGSGNKPAIDRAGGPGSCIVSDNRNWITIRDLIVRNATQQSSSGIIIRGGGYIRIERCDVSNIDNGGIYFVGTNPATTTPCHDSVVVDCTVSGLIDKSDGITVHASSSPPGPAAYQCGANFTFLRNEVSGAREEGFDITTGSNILLEGNYTHDNVGGGIMVGHSAHDVTVRYHRSVNDTNNTAAALQIKVPNVTVEYSTFIGPSVNPKPLVKIYPNNPDLYVAQPEDLVLRNNVFAWNSTAGGQIFNMGAYTNPGTGAVTNLTNVRFTMQNNIFTATTSGVPVIAFAQSGRGPGSQSFQIRNNLYDLTPGVTWTVAGSTYSYSAYKTAFDSGNAWNEVNLDPQFVSSTNFHLFSTGSPAYNAGSSTIYNSEPAMLTVDPDGVSIPQGGTRDIGAFEFPSGGSAPAAPASLTATAVSSSQVDLTWPDVANETGYRIQRKVGSGAYSDLTTKAANSTAHSDTSVSASTSYTYQIRAENGNGESTYTVSNSVTTPSGGGGSPIIYEGETLTVSANSDTVQTVSDANASNGSYHLLNGAGTASFVTYTVNVASAGTYDVAIGLATRNNRGIYQLLVDNVNQGTAQDGYVNSSTTAYEERALGSVTLSAGAHSFRFNCTGKNSSSSTFKHGLDYLKLTPQSSNSVPAITTTTLPGTIAGESYSQTLAATGGDGTLVWSVSAGALPAGLSLSSGGVISGSATTAGTANFTVRVADSDGNTGPTDEDTQALSIVVTANSVPSITTTTLPGTITGEAYSQTLAATGGNGTLVWSLASGTLPAGLGLSSGGVISGSATTAGTSNFTVKVADSDGVTGAGDEDTQALSIVVTANSVPSITTTTLPAGIVGTAYSQTLAATGGNGTLAWSLDSGTLPAGLSLSPGGVISGTPTTAATSNFTVRVADSDGNTGAGDEDTQALSIVINSGASPVTYEAESLTVAANSDTVQIVADAGASNGNYHLLNGSAAGSFVTYTVNVATAGTYNVTTGVTTRNNRGVYQLLIDGVNQGTAQDYYSAGSTTQFAERNLGTKVLSAGNHTFRFNCTGKNAGATQFKQGLDYIKLTLQ